MSPIRRERQAAILRLIREQPISTQTELADALREQGHEVVQTTVSRDIHELGLVKVRAPSGRLVYAEPGSAADRDRLRDLQAALRRFAVGIDANESLVVIFTPPGYASPLSQAIDQAADPQVLATLAGENTILVVPHAGVTAGALADELRHHLLEGAA
jgi:transcriptional regulator of arginine metabolism